MRLLVVEDEKKVANFIHDGFEQEHYAVDVVHDGGDGLQLARRHDYDLVILDIMLPHLSGLEVLQALRKEKPQLPVLMLTARSAVSDRVGALDLGADDYLVKPFAFAELSARVRALLRRGDRQTASFEIADLRLDVVHRTAMRAGRAIELSAKEFALLEFLLRNARRPVTRTSIIEHVWDIHFDCVTNVVDVYVNYLRNKIDKGAALPLIRTIRGVGYILTDQVS